MGVASLVLGIISIILSFIPFIRFLAFLPAVIAIILGGAELASKRKVKKKSESIVGIVLSSIAVVVIIFHLVLGIFLCIVTGSSIIQMIFEEFEDEYNNHPHIYEEYYRYDDYDFEEYENFDSIYHNELI